MTVAIMVKVSGGAVQELTGCKIFGDETGTTFLKTALLNSVSSHFLRIQGSEQAFHS